MTKDIDDILKTRRKVHAPSNLANRIIQASLDKSDKQSWTDIWEEIKGMLIIPQPAYALAATVIFGLLLGLESGSLFEFWEYDSQAFLYLDQGEWL